MRFLVQFTIPTPAGNDAIRSGKIDKFFKGITEEFRPEAMYYFPMDGERAGLMVLRTDNPSICVALGERFWLAVQGKVKLTPCMNGEELAKGLSEIPKIVQTYA